MSKHGLVRNWSIWGCEKPWVRSWFCFFVRGEFLGRDAVSTSNMFKADSVDRSADISGATTASGDACGSSRKTALSSLVSSSSFLIGASLDRDCSFGLQAGSCPSGLHELEAMLL